MDVGAWLRNLGLDRYEAAFRENEIDSTVLPSLTAEDLKDLGVGIVGHRRKLLDAIAALRAEVSAKLPAPDLVPVNDRIARDAAERRQVTVMFSDLVGSTALSARMDPEDLREVIAAYHKCVAEVVRRYDGFIAQYLGDGALIYFGYPQAHEDDAERAVRVGLELIAAVIALKTSVSLQTRVGIATGLVVVGDLMDSGNAAERGIVGETPNLAARLQGIAEPNTVVIGEGTRKLLGNLFELEDLGTRELKGIGKPMRAWAALRATAVESGGGRRSGQRHLTPLVGRDEEIAMLMRRWERSRQGEGQLVLIVGEPGIGKSRLIDEFHARLRDTPHTWIEWSCSQLLQSTPLHPIAEWGRQRFGGPDVPAERQVSDLENTLALTKLDPAENVPLLAPLLDIPIPLERRPILAPEELRHRQLAALTNWVMAGARAQPVVLTLEDLHWADPTTLDVLRGIAERGALTALFVLATARPEFRPPWGARSHHGAISLVPLDRQQVRHMVEELAARHALAKEVIEGVTERTGGVPLFVEEVTRLLLERGEQGGIQAIPPTLQQSLTARLDRLGPVREVAQLAAVIGRGFSYPLVRVVAKMEDQALQTALERLAEADILLVQGLPPESEYRFKHALIQDAAYENLLKSRRQALHRRTAEVLRDQFATTAAAEPELLAHHFTQAGMTEAAIEWWGTAGRRSIARCALVEAAEQLKRALDQIATLPATPALRREEIKLQVAFGNALSLMGDYVGGKEHYDRALALYDPAEHRPLTTRSGRDVGVTLLSVRSPNLWVLGYPTASRNDAERAVNEARKIGHVATLRYALCWASLVYLYYGAFAEAQSLLDELAALADEKDATLFSKATEIALRGVLFAETGKASDAVRAITAGVTSLRSTGAALDEPWHLSHLAKAYSELGQPDDARRCIEDAIDKAERMAKWSEAEVNRVAGEVALKSPAPDTQKAEKYFERALSIAGQRQQKSWELRAAMSLARLWRDQGKSQQARELLAPVYSWFTEGFDTLDLNEARALLAELHS